MGINLLPWNWLSPTNILFHRSSLNKTCKRTSLFHKFELFFAYFGPYFFFVFQKIQMVCVFFWVFFDVFIFKKPCFFANSGMFRAQNWFYLIVSIPDRKVHVEENVLRVYTTREGFCMVLIWRTQRGKNQRRSDRKVPRLAVTQNLLSTSVCALFMKCFNDLNFQYIVVFPFSLKNTEMWHCWIGDEIGKDNLSFCRTFKIFYSGPFLKNIHGSAFVQWFFVGMGHLGPSQGWDFFSNIKRNVPCFSN